MKAQAKKNKLILFWTIFVLLLVSTARAETLPFKSYTTSEGLAHDRVNKIVKDSRGFLWFCTSEGLSRFDGYEFKNYTQDDGLPHRAVNDFLETRGGVIWVATGNGLVLFNSTGVSKRELQSENETAAPMFRVLRPADLKADQKIWDVADLLEDRDGTVWVAASSGLYRLEKQGDWQLRRFETQAFRENRNEDFRILLQDGTGAIWAGTDSGLVRISLDKSGIQTIKKRMSVLSLLEDKEGRVWVGSAGGDETQVGLHLFSYAGDEPREIRVFRKKDGLSDDYWMNALLETSDGRIFVGVGNSLCEYAPQDDAGKPQFRILSNDGIVALAEDASGNVWFSTNSSGVRRLARHGFVIYDKSDGLTGELIASIIPSSDGETYILGNENKIHRFNGTGFDVVTPRGIIPKSWGTGQISFRDHLGAWWIAGATGLQRYPSVGRLKDLESVSPLKTYTTKDGLFTNEVFRLFEDSRGDVWISVIGETVNTLLRWERGSDRIYGYTTADGVPEKNAPTAFGEDRAGNIWIGFYDNALLRYRNGKFESFTAADNLPAGFVHNIFTDSAGRVWVATGAGGAARIDNPASDEKPLLTNITTRDGLSSSQATCVTEDDFGRIYIGTGRGVNRLDLRTGRIKIFTKADGLPENIVTRCKRDASGALWFGTAKGLARYTPVAEEQSKPPPVFLSDFRAGGESIKKLSELGETAIENLDFAADQRQIEIDFFALGFSTGESLRYQYKLEGTGADWSEPTALRTVNFNLSSGKYRFLVRAVNSEGVTSDQSAMVAFQIARPVWQRWWFLILAALIIGFLIYSLYRYRVAQLLKLERVRTRIATDLHDDIGSSLSQIAILSEVVRQKVGDNGAAVPLNLIADTSREMVDSMSDIVWAINPDKDHLADLIQRMRRFASDILDAKDILYRFHFDEKHRDVALGADIRREVYLIFKECVNNLVKYAEASEVEMSARIENNSLVVKVKDNGKGFVLSNSSAVAGRLISEKDYDGFGGNGLINMRRRAENLGGRFSIESEKDAGTSVEIKIPI
jgi:ligand-binding sensor domain-containing protein/two-component sensor histidine kinase